jgi:chromate reductase
MPKLKIVAISGSLKSTSSNTNILKALSKYRKEEIEFILFEDLGELPHFNPEKEEGTSSVVSFRKLLKDADGVVISTPEYAFGIPGALKNALDWTVSSGELNEKPVIAISASPMYEGGNRALASLLLTLNALGTKMTEKSSMSIGNVYKKIDASGKVIDEQTITDLKFLFDQFITSITKSKTTNKTY